MLDTNTVANIKAAEGIYRASAVAAHYNVDRSTIYRIWKGERHRQVIAAGDYPDIHTKPRPREVADDIRTLLDRGLSPKEVADTLGISERSVWTYKDVWL